MIAALTAARRVYPVSQSLTTLQRDSRHFLTMRGKSHEKKPSYLEHHKNILIGLNEKLTVYNDLKLDCEANRQAFAESESARAELQNHIQDTTIHVAEAANDNKAFQETLIQENNNLK